MGKSMGSLNVLIVGVSYPSWFAKAATLRPGV